MRQFEVCLFMDWTPNKWRPVESDKFNGTNVYISEKIYFLRKVRPEIRQTTHRVSELRLPVTDNAYPAW